MPSQIPEYLTRIEIWIQRCLSPGTTLLLSINSGPTLRHIMYMAYEEAQEEEDDLGEKAGCNEHDDGFGREPHRGHDGH